MIQYFKSKEELYEFLNHDTLVGLDSEYSLTTKKLKEQFNAKGIHFNKWWIYTPTSWKCPVCDRNKSEIVKLNKHNDLSGQLHEHHDHMEDLAKKRFDEISALKKNIIADSLAEKFIIRLSYALASYDKTIICSDCNYADKQAKQIVNAHQYFSFSPSEISKFIIVKANKEHEIDENIAKKLWKEQLNTFTIRLELVDTIADIAAKNVHWYQPSNETAVQTMKKANFYLEKHGLKEISRIYPEKLLYKAEVYKGKTNMWRNNLKKIIAKKPTDGQIKHMSNTNGKFWNRLKENWSCPICKRNKISCIQPSKKNPWMFLTVQKEFFNYDNLRWYEELVICNECSKTSTLIQKEVDSNNKLQIGNWLITVQELIDVIIPQENTSHLINNQYIDNILIPILIERLEYDHYSNSKLAPK